MGIRFLDEETPPPVNNAGGGMGDVLGAVQDAFIPPKNRVRFLDEGEMLPPGKGSKWPTIQGVKQIAESAGTDALGAVRDTAMAPFNLAETLRQDPHEMNRQVGPWLPAAGAAIGTAFAPVTGGASIPVGAGLGEIARQAGDIAFEEPGRQLAGENFSPRAGGEAALQTLMAGAGEVSGVLKSAKGAKPYLQRGLEKTGEALAPVSEGIKRMAAGATEVMSGAKARNAMKVIEKPSRLLKGMFQGKKLGKAVEEAEEGLANRLMTREGPDLPGQFRLTKRLAAEITTNKGGVADDIVTDLLVKADNPASISADEAMAGIKAIDRTFPNYTEKTAGIVQKYSDLRAKLSNIVGEVDPKVAAAKGAAHDAKVGGSFRHLSRQTKTGKTSAVPFLSFLLGPSNWSLPELGKQALRLPLFSPAVYGTGLALGSAAAKTVGAAITNPTARQALISRYITSRNDKGKQ